IWWKSRRSMTRRASLLFSPPRSSSIFSASSFISAARESLLWATDEALHIEDHESLLRHLADRVARSFAADAAILDAAIGELISAPGRGAVENDGTGANASHSFDRDRHGCRHHTALETKPAGGDGRKHLFDVLIFLYGDNRPEHLLANHP